MVRRPARVARTARLTSQAGLALGVAFAVCFVTGLLSHYIQHPPPLFWWPSRPAGLYRVTQGLHVATGLVCVPLLGVKLWSVYPKLFVWPPVRDPAHAIERMGIAALVAGSLFQVVSGVLNVARWYTPMPFFFTAGHFWVSWLTIGGLLAHIGVKLPLIRDALRGREASAGRRTLLRAAAIAAGTITLGTVGQTVAPLAPVSLLAPRRPRDGPQRVPVNKTADAAGVRTAALSPAYRMTVIGPRGRLDLTLEGLRALPQRTVVLPIACVEGWSSTGTWTGVRLLDLARMVAADPGEVTVVSLQPHGRYRTSVVARPHLEDPWTLIALDLNGGPLHLDHGYPARLIAPNRPGVMQTKWIARIDVRAGS